MKTILTNETNDVFGPFISVEAIDGGYLCDETIYYTTVTGEVVLSEVPDDYVTPQQIAAQEEANKAIAVTLLQATDWTQIPSVSDPSLSNPYSSNKLAFDQYRNDVRQYAVYPVAGNITWPTVPTENWVKV